MDRTFVLLLNKRNTTKTIKRNKNYFFTVQYPPVIVSVIENETIQAYNHCNLVTSVTIVYWKILKRGVICKVDGRESKWTVRGDSNGRLKHQSFILHDPKSLNWTVSGKARFSQWFIKRFRSLSWPFENETNSSYYYWNIW